MKGVILAGGTGSRLFPCTKVTNKHLLPVYNKPMIYYPIETLKKSGIQDVLIISSPQHAGDFMQLLGSGVDMNINFTYRIQDGAGGIAQALSLAENFAGKESIAVILSDNIFENDFSEEVMYFKSGAHIFVKPIENPERFGVVEIREDGSVRSIEEKPSFPKSEYAQTGFYLYDNQVFDLIRKIQPSKRGELEITDLNNLYLKNNELKASVFSGMWADAGTHDSLLEANILAYETFQTPQIRGKDRVEITPKHSPKITIGLLTYNSEKYLEYCLESLLKQDYENMEIIVLDNKSTDKTIDIMKKNYSHIELIESRENLGFGRGHNRIINESESDFYGCFNIDMVFESNFVSELIKTISEKPFYGSVTGKLKRWDFESFTKNSNIDNEIGKTNFIDSVGISIAKNHQFNDIGQGEVDYGQYDQEGNIFGASGAAVVYRRKALEDIAFVDENKEKEYFDTCMFMYKEDIDLAYRLQWQEWKCRYTHQAVAYHDRTAKHKNYKIWNRIKARNSRNPQINRNSYLNHQILLQKNYTPDFSSKVGASTFFYNLKVLLYLLVFEQKTLLMRYQLFKLRSQIKERKEAIKRKANPKEIQKFMES